MPALIPVAIAAYSAISTADSQRKAINNQKDAAKSSQVNIDQLNETTKAISQQNAIDSANLEKQLTPEVPQLRQQANQGVINGLTQDPGTQLANSYLMSTLGVPVGHELNPTLLQAAIAKAGQDLSLGGKLPQDVQNLVTRHALANAGSVAPGQLNLGRDLTTRDLGLTSLDLENRRLANASQLGGQQLALGQANNDLAFNNNAAQLNRAQLIRQMSDSNFARNLSAAQFGQSIQQPNVGLSPTSIANISVGNSNAQGAAYANQSNIAGQQSQNYQNLFGNALGYGLMQYNQSKAAPVINTAQNSPTGYVTPGGNVGVQTSGFFG